MFGDYIRVREGRTDTRDFRRLTADEYGWLTTVAKSGQPVPRLIWFFFDGSDLVVYTEPSAAKVNHIRRHPQVSLNLDSAATAPASW